jgi:hypothetical protein
MEQTGQELVDDEVLAAAGITDLSQYQPANGSKLELDLFID